MKKIIQKRMALFLVSIMMIGVLPTSTYAASLSKESSEYVRVNNAAVWADYDEITGDLYVIMAFDNNNNVVVSMANLKDNLNIIYDATFENINLPRASKYSNEYWEYLKTYAEENNSKLKANRDIIKKYEAANTRNATADAAISTLVRQTYGNEYNNLLVTDTASYPGHTIRIYEQFVHAINGNFTMTDVRIGYAVTSVVSAILDGLGYAYSPNSVATPRVTILEAFQAVTQGINELCANIINTANNTFTANETIYPYTCSPTRTRYGTVNGLNISFSEAWYDLDCIALYGANSRRSVLKTHAYSYFPTEYAYNSPNHVWLKREAYLAYQNYI